jgi:AraC-like DNA-binding protein
MKHHSAAQIEYRPLGGVTGVETLSAKHLHTKFDRHFHDTYSFGIVLEGVERCSLGRDVSTYEAGTVPLFNPGEVHDGGPATEGGWSYRMVYVDPSLVEGERAFPGAARRDPAARRTVQQLFDAIDCGTLLGVEETLDLALQTLLAIPTTKPVETGFAMLRVRERIDAECCQPLRLRDLCSVAGVSPTRVLRAFEASYGLTPHRYQQSRRVAKARRMIHSGAALAEVASACGYADQSHLNRWFLRLHGTTPGRFRRAFFS